MTFWSFWCYSSYFIFESTVYLDWTSALVTKDNSNIFVGMYDDRIDAIILLLLLYYFMLHPRRARFIIVNIILYAYWYKNFGQFMIFEQSSLTIYIMDVVHRRQQQLLPRDFQTMHAIIYWTATLIFLLRPYYIYILTFVFRILYVAHIVLERGKLARILCDNSEFNVH